MKPLIRLSHTISRIFPLHAILPALIGVGIVTLALAAILALVIVGIHREERRSGLTREPRGLPRTLARWVLGSHADPPA
jgi:hypothetical protein